MKHLKPYAKAIAAALVAGVGGIAAGYVDDVLTTGEVWAALALATTSGATVFGIPNRPVQ